MLEVVRSCRTWRSCPELPGGYKHSPKLPGCPHGAEIYQTLSGTFRTISQTFQDGNTQLSRKGRRDWSHRTTELPELNAFNKLTGLCD